MTINIKPLVVAVMVLLGACQSLPPSPHLPQSTPTAKNTDSLLSALVKKDTQKHPDLSAYYPISTGADAFAVRSLLTDLSQNSIDVQYYIWHNDETGQLLLKDLWRAGERGVAVRLLVDDLGISTRTSHQLAWLASHPNIAVRLANPFSYRKFRSLEYLKSPQRLNTRMHNKSMTFDKQISIIGGRNIGDEYLNNDLTNNFADLDVLLIGDVVSQIDDSFEQFWQSPNSYDIHTLIAPHTITGDMQALFDKDDYERQQLTGKENTLQRQRKANQTASLDEKILAWQVPFRWTNIRFFSDNPQKLSRQAPKEDFLVAQLRKAITPPTRRLSIISSYFIPTKDGVAMLTALSKAGVKVSILTNALEATDVPFVHTGYHHWRYDLVSAGVKLYELKRHATTPQGNNPHWQNPNATASLHAKAFAVDESQVFIGSYNIDPRSANINTELGVVIEDTALATRLHHALNNSTTPNDALLHQAYELDIADGKLIWKTKEGNETVIYDNEPSTNLPTRLGIGVVGLLPLDWLL